MEIVLTLDVGHPPRKPDQVEHQLEEAISKVRGSSSFRVLKIIHGQSGKTKQIVRNWAYNKRRRLRGIIYGENYSIFDKQTQEMRVEVGQFPDSDLEASNGGIIILWVK
ncbi:MAG: hypothetical protein QME52_13165 [Bacteroidota bacterium]|nr:hypothetical protein [Bacteroidota bacterium]